MRWAPVFQVSVISLGTLPTKPSAEPVEMHVTDNMPAVEPRGTSGERLNEVMGSFVGFLEGMR